MKNAKDCFGSDVVARILSHRNIVFTKEIETNNCLHFLDILIEKSSTGLITSTYMKPTHTGLYSKWSSFAPLRRKRNLVNSTHQFGGTGNVISVAE